MIGCQKWTAAPPRGSIPIFTPDERIASISMTLRQIGDIGTDVVVTVNASGFAGAFVGDPLHARKPFF